MVQLLGLFGLDRFHFIFHQFLVVFHDRLGALLDPAITLFSRKLQLFGASWLLRTSKFLRWRGQINLRRLSPNGSLLLQLWETVTLPHNIILALIRHFDLLKTNSKRRYGARVLLLYSDWWFLFQLFFEHLIINVFSCWIKFDLYTSSSLFLLWFLNWWWR